MSQLHHLCEANNKETMYKFRTRLYHDQPTLAETISLVRDPPAILSNKQTNQHPYRNTARHDVTVEKAGRLILINLKRIFIFRATIYK